jgi:uncharacterized RDD family membrane protein YckC
MVNCVECGAPLERAGEPCAACGTPCTPATTNGTHQPRFEDPNGLVRDERPLQLGESPRHDHGEAPGGGSGASEDAATRALRFATVAEQRGPREPQAASFLRRGAALFLDLALLSVLDAVLVVLATSAVLLAERITGLRVGGAVDLVRSAVSAGSLTLFVGYFSVLQARSGQTLGKAAMKIRVCTVEGGRVPILQSVLRTFSYVLSVLMFGAGFLLALLPSHRALHDFVAGTRVVWVEGSE